MWIDFGPCGNSTTRVRCLNLPSTSLPADPGQGLTEPMIFFDPNLSSTPPWADAPATPSSGLGYTYDFELPTMTRPELALITPVRRRVPLAARDRFRLRLEEIQ
jgi:hypothetical protein